MIPMDYLQALQARTVEHFDLLNSSMFDEILPSYAPDVRFSLPALPGERGSGTVIGSGRSELRGCFERLIENFGPLHVVDVFGFASTRSFIVDDRDAGRIMFTAEIGACGLALSIFGVRTAAPRTRAAS